MTKFYFVATHRLPAYLAMTSNQFPSVQWYPADDAYVVAAYATKIAAVDQHLSRHVNVLLWISFYACCLAYVHIFVSFCFS